MAPPIKTKFAVETTEQLAACANDAKDRIATMRAAEGQWAAGALKAAEALYAARRRLEHDVAFHEWCNANELGEDVISKNERAALIKVGSNMPYWSARIAEAKSRSIRMIVENNPPPDVSRDRETSPLSPRHKTKPGPKPAAPSSAFERAEALSKERERVAVEKANASSHVLTGEVLGPERAPAPAKEVRVARVEVVPAQGEFLGALQEAARAKTVSLAQAMWAEVKSPPVPVLENEPEKTAAELRAELMEVREAYKALKLTYEALKLAYDRLCAEKGAALSPDSPVRH